MNNLIFFYHGLLAMLAQLVIFRELAVIFYGNELFLGIFLASWLFWVGLGSLLAKRLSRKEKLSGKYFFSGFLALSILLPLIILFIRISKSLFSFGEFIGPLATVSYTFVIMGLLCFIIGAQFSLGCALAWRNSEKENALGRVYLCESAGSVIAGVLFTYVLIGVMPLFMIVLFLSLGCVLVSLSMTGRKLSAQNMAIMAFALVLAGVYFKIEPLVNKLEWRGYRFIKQKETRNATLSLVKMGSIVNVFADGLLSASFPDPESYELLTHWPLLATAEPSRVLILGDWSLGTLKEALKHSPKRVDYVILDNSFLNLVRPYLSSEDNSALRDKRVDIHYGDMRLFVRNSAKGLRLNFGQENKYDTVMINIREVPNLKLNRFFTREFYSQVKSIIRPAGVLAVSVVSSENYLSGNTRKFNALVFRTLKSVFAEIEMIPGDNLMFLCSSLAIDTRQETILARFENRRLANRYFIPSYIEYKLNFARRAELKKILEETPGIEMNRDFLPAACYYFSGFWLNKLTLPVEYFMAGALIFLAAFFAFKKRKVLHSFFHSRERVLVFSLGLTGISLEMILLLSFQIASGNVYWQMGILFASFMGGLFLGGVFGGKLKSAPAEKKWMALVELSSAIIISSLFLKYFLPGLINFPVLQSIIIFLLFLLFIGVIVGASFVISGFLILENEITTKAGSLYSADLWGAALGAILSANLIIPLFGFLGALNFSAVTGTFGLAAFLILSKEK